MLFTVLPRPVVAREGSATVHPWLRSQIKETHSFREALEGSLVASDSRSSQPCDGLAPLSPRLHPQTPSLPTLSPLLKNWGQNPLRGDKQEGETTVGVQEFPGDCVSTSLTTAP